MRHSNCPELISMGITWDNKIIDFFCVDERCNVLKKIIEIIATVIARKKHLTYLMYQVNLTGVYPCGIKFLS